MPSVSGRKATKEDYPVEPYTRPPLTNETPDYADLVVIDVSRFDEPGEKARLAAQLDDAVRNVGFWIVTGHGIKDEEICRQLAIATKFFSLPLESKRLVPIDLARDFNFGYREPTRIFGDTGVRETVETYEVRKDIEKFKHVPLHPMLEAYWDEIGPFHKKMYDAILSKLYILIAIILELPEDYFVKLTLYENTSEDRIRWMIQPPSSLEEHEIKEKHGVGGHADFGALTLLFEQNITGLQMLTRQGTWKYVRPIHGGVTVNAAECLNFLTSGYVKATIHRVSRPSMDQLDYPRLGLIYFSQFNHGVKLKPCPSPKLLRLGLVSEEALTSEDYPVVEEYTRARFRKVHHTASYAKRDLKDEFEYKGLKVQSHFD